MVHLSGINIASAGSKKPRYSTCVCSDVSHTLATQSLRAGRNLSMYAGTQMPGPLAPIRVSVCGEREGGEGWEGERGCDLLKDGHGDARL